jgi:hypothetical protein
VTEVRANLIERDREANLVVDVADAGEIRFDQHDAGVTQARERNVQDLRKLAVEPLPEIAARQTDPRAFQARRLRRRITGDHRIEERHIGVGI